MNQELLHKIQSEQFRKEASSFGIMHINEDLCIKRFVEKPKDPAVLDSLQLPKEWLAKLGVN